MQNKTSQLLTALAIAGLATAVAAPAVATQPGSVPPSAVTSAPARVPQWQNVAALFPSFLQSPAVRTTATLEARIHRLMPARIKHAPLGRDVAVRVEDLTTGRTVFAHRSTRGMIPASTMKLATALAVLSARDKDRVLPTVVRHTPRARRVVIVGGGDPLLSSADINRLARTSARRILRQGLPDRPLLIRYDASLFAYAALAPGWPSSYLRNYVARPTALMRDRRKVANPAYDAAVYFRKRLIAHGLKGHVRRSVRSVKSSRSEQRIAHIRSHTVSDAVWRMLRYSDNTVAEVMIRHVALGRRTSTTTHGSAAAVRAELADLRVPLHRARFYDGSGLSRYNRLPGRTLTGIVRASANPAKTDLSSPYREWSVPIAGWTGTLYSRFTSKRSRCARGLVMAKTGTLSNVVSLSGVAIGNDGRHRAFSIVVNNRPQNKSLAAARERVDRLAATVTGCR